MIQFSNRFVLLFFIVIVSGCASLHGAITENIDDRQVEYALSGNGNDVVVFENGLDGTIDWWAKVFPDIAHDATAFAYNRPGYGKSSVASTPRDDVHIVEELRSLLRSKGLKPPYILVGHSVGGLYMQGFARGHPTEVRALILVDSTHPEQFKAAGSPENWPAWVRLAFGLAVSTVAKEEFDAINGSGEHIMKMPAPKAMRVIILSALQPMHAKSALADDANEKRKDIARLYPGATQIWVDSGHGIPLEKPEAVVSAIREAMSKN